MKEWISCKIPERFADRGTYVMSHTDQRWWDPAIHIWHDCDLKEKKQDIVMCNELEIEIKGK